MLNKIVEYVHEHKSSLCQSSVDACFSLTATITTVGVMQLVLGWLLHTVAACVTTVVVSVVVYFVMRKIKQMFP